MSTAWTSPCTPSDGAPYDYRRSLLAFSITSEDSGAGVYLPEHRWELSGGARVHPREEP